MKRFLPLVLIFFIFVTGAGLVVYPLISNALYEQDQSQVQASYDESLAEKDQAQLDEALQDARDYNEALVAGQAVLTDPFDPTLIQDPQAEPYASLLNLDGDGIMGYVEVPRIDVYLPIYHGTTTDVLEKGVGHLQSTTLPVGGEGTHAVLTGHTGLAGKRLFTDLTELETGDVFYLHVLGQVLAYQVERIDVVEPTDTSLLVVQPGRDLVTLVTCTPYGINTHRLLIQGSLIPYEQAVQAQSVRAQDAPVSVWKQEYLKALVLCLLLYIPLTLLVLWLLLHRRRKKRQPTKN